MIFYYVRHGDPIYDPDSLTPLGHRQAEAVGKRLSVYGLDKIYASSSTRARQTAQPAAEMMKKEVTVLDWCSEDHAWQELTVRGEKGERYWLFQHRATRELLAGREIQNMGNDFYLHEAFASQGCYDTERIASGLKRIGSCSDEFFASLGYRHDSERGGYIVERENNERVALFAHQGFGLAFLSCLLDIPYPAMALKFDFGHSGVSVIEFSGKEGELCIPRVIQLSNDSHLYKEGIGTKYQNRIYI